MDKVHFETPFSNLLGEDMGQGTFCSCIRSIPTPILTPLTTSLVLSLPTPLCSPLLLPTHLSLVAIEEICTLDLFKTLLGGLGNGPGSVQWSAGCCGGRSGGPVSSTQTSSVLPGAHSPALASSLSGQCRSGDSWDHHRGGAPSHFCRITSNTNRQAYLRSGMYVKSCLRVTLKRNRDSTSLELMAKLVYLALEVVVAALCRCLLVGCTMEDVGDDGPPHIHDHNFLSHTTHSLHLPRGRVESPTQRMASQTVGSCPEGHRSLQDHTCSHTQ
uniref:Uncharacterized protein n=1 Tax=Timema poppense TaxID=170557 RepID=A0A7R9D4F1_TIMPO|nr:unnamed protein product [Timema poppensis]